MRRKMLKTRPAVTLFILCCCSSGIWALPTSPIYEPPSSTRKAQKNDKATSKNDGPHFPTTLTGLRTTATNVVPSVLDYSALGLRRSKSQIDRQAAQPISPHTVFPVYIPDRAPDTQPISPQSNTYTLPSDTNHIWHQILLSQKGEEPSISHDTLTPDRDLILTPYGPHYQPLWGSSNPWDWILNSRRYGSHSNRDCPPYSNSNNYPNQPDVNIEEYDNPRFGYYGSIPYSNDFYPPSYYGSALYQTEELQNSNYPPTGYSNNYQFESTAMPSFSTFKPYGVWPHQNAYQSFGSGSSFSVFGNVFNQQTNGEKYSTSTLHQQAELHHGSTQLNSGIHSNNYDQNPSNSLVVGTASVTSAEKNKATSENIMATSIHNTNNGIPNSSQPNAQTTHFVVEVENEGSSFSKPHQTGTQHNLFSEITVQSQQGALSITNKTPHHPTVQHSESTHTHQSSMNYGSNAAPSNGESSQTVHALQQAMIDQNTNQNQASEEISHSTGTTISIQAQSAEIKPQITAGTSMVNNVQALDVHQHGTQTEHSVTQQSIISSLENAESSGQQQAAQGNAEKHAETEPTPDINLPFQSSSVKPELIPESLITIQSQASSNKTPIDHLMEHQLISTATNENQEGGYQSTVSSSSSSMFNYSSVISNSEYDNSKLQGSHQNPMVATSEDITVQLSKNKSSTIGQTQYSTVHSQIVGDTSGFSINIQEKQNSKPGAELHTTDQVTSQYIDKESNSAIIINQISQSQTLAGASSSNFATEEKNQNTSHQNPTSEAIGEAIGINLNLTQLLAGHQPIIVEQQQPSVHTIELAEQSSSKVQVGSEHTQPAMQGQVDGLVSLSTQELNPVLNSDSSMQHQMASNVTTTSSQTVTGSENFNVQHGTSDIHFIDFGQGTHLSPVKSQLPSTAEVLTAVHEQPVNQPPSPAGITVHSVNNFISTQSQNVVASQSNEESSFNSKNSSTIIVDMQGKEKLTSSTSQNILSSSTISQTENSLISLNGNVGPTPDIHGVTLASLVPSGSSSTPKQSNGSPTHNEQQIIASVTETSVHVTSNVDIEHYAGNHSAQNAYESSATKKETNFSASQSPSLAIISLAVEGDGNLVKPLKVEHSEIIGPATGSHMIHGEHTTNEVGEIQSNSNLSGHSNASSTIVSNIWSHQSSVTLSSTPGPETGNIDSGNVVAIDVNIDENHHGYDSNYSTHQHQHVSSEVSSGISKPDATSVVSASISERLPDISGQSIYGVSQHTEVVQKVSQTSNLLTNSQVVGETISLIKPVGSTETKTGSQGLYAGHAETSNEAQTGIESIAATGNLNTHDHSTSEENVFTNTLSPIPKPDNHSNQKITVVETSGGAQLQSTQTSESVVPMGNPSNENVIQSSIETVSHHFEVGDHSSEINAQIVSSGSHEGSDGHTVHTLGIGEIQNSQTIVETVHPSVHHTIQNPVAIHTNTSDIQSNSQAFVPSTNKVTTHSTIQEGSSHKINFSPAALGSNVEQQETVHQFISGSSKENISTETTTSQYFVEVSQNTSLSSSERVNEELASSESNGSHLQNSGGNSETLVSQSNFEAVSHSTIHVLHNISDAEISHEQQNTTSSTILVTPTPGAQIGAILPLQNINSSKETLAVSIDNFDRPMESLHNDKTATIETFAQAHAQMASIHLSAPSKQNVDMHPSNEMGPHPDLVAANPNPSSSSLPESTHAAGFQTSSGIQDLNFGYNSTVHAISNLNNVEIEVVQENQQNITTSVVSTIPQPEVLDSHFELENQNSTKLAIAPTETMGSHVENSVQENPEGGKISTDKNSANANIQVATIHSFDIILPHDIAHNGGQTIQNAHGSSESSSFVQSITRQPITDSATQLHQITNSAGQGNLQVGFQEHGTQQLMETSGALNIAQNSIVTQQKDHAQAISVQLSGNTSSSNSQSTSSSEIFTVTNNTDENQSNRPSWTHFVSSVSGQAKQPISTETQQVPQYGQPFIGRPISLPTISDFSRFQVSEDEFHQFNRIPRENLIMISAEYFISLLQHNKCDTLQTLIPILQRPMSGVILSNVNTVQ